MNVFKRRSGNDPSEPAVSSLDAPEPPAEPSAPAIPPAAPYVAAAPAPPQPGGESVPGQGAGATPVVTAPAFRGPLESALRHPFLTLLPVIALTAAGVAIGLVRMPNYSAEARINVGRVDVPAYTLQNVIAGNATLAASYARAAQAPGVVRPAARAARVSVSEAEANLSATPVPQTTLISVNADGDSRAGAITLANAGARSLIDYVTALTNRQEGGGVLASYREAQLRTDRARRRLIELGAHHAHSSDAYQQARLDLLTAQLHSQSLSTKYVQGEAGPDPQNIMQIVGPAAGASSDRTTVLERLALVGFAVGIILGLALALLRANRGLLARRPA